jgi:hypothetical protein
MPPERKVTPGTAGGTVRRRHVTVASAICAGVAFLSAGAASPERRERGVPRGLADRRRLGADEADQLVEPRLDAAVAVAGRAKAERVEPRRADGGAERVGRVGEEAERRGREVREQRQVLDAHARPRVLCDDREPQRAALEVRAQRV